MTGLDNSRFALAAKSSVDTFWTHTDLGRGRETEVRLVELPDDVSQAVLRAQATQHG